MSEMSLYFMGKMGLKCKCEALSEMFTLWVWDFLNGVSKMSLKCEALSLVNSLLKGDLTWIS
jgi:hypothetical protein